MVVVEWVANGRFEKWSGKMPSLFHQLFPAQLRMVEGYSGFGVLVEGGGIYQYVETMLGIEYKLSVQHKGGKGAVNIITSLSASPAVSVPLKKDEKFEEYSFKWKASSSRIWLLLSDEEDGEPSVFDELSFTTEGFEVESGYELVIGGNFEFWRRIAGALMPLDGWKVLGSAYISQAEGFQGYGVKIEAKDANSGLKQFMSIDKGEEYILSARHKGGRARVQLTDNETGHVLTDLPIGEDDDWRTYSAELRAETTSVCIRLIDELDSKPSYFDDASLKGTPSGSVTYEPPINVIFVLHVEPMTKPGMISSSEEYEDWRQNILWLKTKAEEYGHKITALFNGEYMEYVVDHGHEEEIRQFIRGGHQVGTHIHDVCREAPHKWTVEGRGLDVRKWEDVIKQWESAVEWVEKVIPHSENITVCAAVIPPFERKLMEKFGFKIAASQGAGPDPTRRSRCNVGYDYIGHQPYFPYRPSSIDMLGHEMFEDLSTPYVNIEHYAQIGKEIAHGAPSRLIDFQRYFLNTYRAWLSKESTPEPEGKDKFWIFGWANHAGTPAYRGPMNERVKEDIEKFFYWLNTNFVGRKTPRGNIIAKTATMREVYKEFMEWEKKHPGQSSFSYVYPKDEEYRR